MAVASFASVRVSWDRGEPLFLFESGAAHVARISTGVVFTLAHEFRRSWVLGNAFVSVTVAFAPATNRNVFDRVEISSGNS